MTFRRLRWALALLVVAAAAGYFASEPILRSMGRALVVDEPLSPADIIVVSGYTEGAGTLEAADLVQSGIAQRVAVFVDPPAGEDLEFIRRGLPYEDRAAMQIRQLKSLGVTDIVQIPMPDAGTRSESQMLPQWSEEHGFRSIVMIASADHSRRLRRVLDRTMAGRPTRVTVHRTRYASFDPDRWWHTRHDTRTAIVELQKLVWDFVQHPNLFGAR